MIDIGIISSLFFRSTRLVPSRRMVHPEVFLCGLLVRCSRSLLENILQASISLTKATSATSSFKYLAQATPNDKILVAGSGHFHQFEISHIHHDDYSLPAYPIVKKLFNHWVASVSPRLQFFAEILIIPAA
jgi:hypothetical protein